MTRTKSIVALLCLGLSAASLRAGPVEFPLIGKIKPRGAKEIASSSWSIGGETLDRDYAVYANYRKYLGPLGAKHIRLQAGWAKCEKKPGVYDFAWIDEIVNDAISQGVQPWLETSYGNTIYPDGGGTGLGGGLPKSPEALAAWDQWVKALVVHFKDRVFEWEIWNEPDIGKNNAPEDYAALFIRTAEIIRGEQAKAKIFALGLAHDLDFAEKFLDTVKAANKLGLIDALTIHTYPKNPDHVGPLVQARALAAKYSSTIEIRQGETGAPSTAATFGALSDHAWTELTQAKWDLRRMLAHHALGIPFNLFTLMELQYPGRMNTKGLLKAGAGMTVEREKPAYFAAQNVFAIFDNELKNSADIQLLTASELKPAWSVYRNKEDAQLVALWLKEGVPAEENSKKPLDFTLNGARFSEPVYVDLIDGNVFKVPAEYWRQDVDHCSFRGIPVYDAPILVAERLLVPMIAR